MTLEQALLRIQALEAALAECQKVRDQWCKEFTEQRDDAEALVKRCAALETMAELSETKDKFCRYLLIGGAGESCPVCGEGPCQTASSDCGEPGRKIPEG